MKKIYIHIGYHKTSSTFLQTEIFPYLNDVDYIGTYYKKNSSVLDVLLKRQSVQKQILKKTGIVSDFAYKAGVAPSLNMSSKTICELKELIDKSSSEKILISSEDFLRPFFYEEMAVFVSDILSNYELEILMVVREQSSIIMSRYSHDLKAMNIEYDLSKSLDYNSGLFCYYPICKHLNKDLPCVCDIKKSKTININFYNYNLVYDVLNKYFSNVNIILYEDLYSKNNELQSLLTTLDTSFSYGFNMNSIISNKVGGRSEHEKTKVKEKNKKIICQIKEIYKDGNIKLSKKVSYIDFNKHGYL